MTIKQDVTYEYGIASSKEITAFEVDGVRYHIPYSNDWEPGEQYVRSLFSILNDNSFCQPDEEGYCTCNPGLHSYAVIGFNIPHDPDFAARASHP